MTDENGKVKPKRVGTRAWRRLQWIRKHYGEEGYSDCALHLQPRGSVARLLEDLAPLVRQNAVVVWIIGFRLNDEQATMPRIYEEYLRTPEWQDRRMEALDKAGHRCQVCNSEDGLEVHHRTYERIGEEEPGDLCVLCRECHSLFHEKRSLAK